MSEKLNHIDPLQFNDLVCRVHLSKDMVTIKDNNGPKLWLYHDEARALRNWLDKVLP